MRAQFVLQEIWIGLRRNLTMTISLVITVAIAMALFGTGLLIKAQATASKDYWYGRVQVSIFLCVQSSANTNCNKTAATEEQKNAIKDALRKLDYVDNFQYESQSEALQRFKQGFSSQPGLTNNVQNGDIPDSYRVKLKDPAQASALAQRMSNMPGVDQALNEQDILKRLFTILGGLESAALVIAFIQLVAAVLLVANTVRLSAFNRRRETGIMRLVGASNLYIQLPFILEGTVAGMVGGLISAVLLIGSKTFLLDSLQSSLQFSSQLGWGSVFLIIIASISLGVLLCALASFLTLRRYLKI
jgi:cell division transport system permease protein